METLQNEVRNTFKMLRGIIRDYNTESGRERLIVVRIVAELFLILMDQRSGER